jgi:uncharacterized cupredoxin-like copper-binding protein/mono/diheme cytochrome c family protein
VVIIGLVALSTILVLYAADEPNRIAEADQTQQHIEVERAIGNYIQYCLSCHGPAGEGYSEGTDRLGMPLGGNTSATRLNQEGINASGTPYPGGIEARRAFLLKTIHNGRGTIMPAWGQENGGQLNDEQIEELVTMIMHVDWNEVYNESIEVSGGYPTVAPTEAPTTATAAAGSTSTEEAGAPSDGPITLNMHDTYFEPTSLTIPSNTATTIHVVNQGATTHNFSVPALNVSIDLEAGAEADVEIPATAAGEYDFDCNIPGHKEAGMVGKLTVSDAAAAPAEDEAEAPPPAESTEPAAAPQPVTITMGDTFFDPTTATIPADTATTIHVVNNGATLHNFSIPELNVSVDVDAGASADVEIPATAAGEYDFDCDVPGHKEAGMVGKLTVQ